MPANTNPTFAARGKVVTDFSGRSEESATSVVVLPDGRILVAGATSDGIHGYRFAAARYNANGSVDTTLDGDGRLTTAIGTPGGLDQGLAVALQSDGKFLVGGITLTAGGTFDIALVRYNPNGTLDTTFSGDGKLTTSLGPHNDLAYGIALQADGRIVVAGSTSDGLLDDFAVVRYNADGTLDATFSGDGKVTTDFGSGPDWGAAVAIQPDGRIVVAGSVATETTRFGFGVARYNANGTLDTTFDGDGKALTPFIVVTDPVHGTTIQRDALASSVTLQSDGKIVVAGQMFTGDGNSDFALARYNANGSLDTGFSGDGILTMPIGSFGDVAQSVALQSDGKIIVAGYGFGDFVSGSGNDFALVRLNGDGSLDTTFGGDGIVTTDFGFFSDYGASVRVQADGRILVAGTGRSDFDGDFALVRYNADGSLDTTFGGMNTLDYASLLVVGAGAALLDFNVQVFDAELAAQGHYGGATLRLARHGGASADDVFSAVLYLDALTQGGALVYAGTNIGTVTTNSGGVLLLTFNSNATQARVNGALQSLGYSTSSAAPPASVQIDWLFSDGNAGGQGTGGALSVTGSTTVTIVLPKVLLWSTLADGQLISDFQPAVDTLHFDDPLVAAADVSVTRGSAIFSLGAKTVTLTIDIAMLSPSSFIFDGGGGLLIGDLGIGNAADELANTIQGGSADDHLMGLAGDDYLEGGVGGDRLNGGPGSDTAGYGGAGPGVTVDLGGVLAGTGEALGDTFISVENVVGSFYPDNLYGDDGANTLEGRDGNDRINGRDGSDTLDGGNGVDSLYGMAGHDTLQGGADGDNLYGGAGQDVLDGGADFDWARYDTAPAAVTADLMGTVAGAGDAEGDTFTLIEGLVGSAFNDRFLGNALANTLQGREGNDSLYGRAGADTLQGGAGSDNLYGEAGGDALDGGADFDWARYDTASGAVTADLSGATAGTGDGLGDRFALIEGLVGSKFGDRLFGDALSNALQGRDGNDELDGRAGADTLTGGAGNDTFRFKAGEANGDKIADFDGGGALARDQLVFQGYGATHSLVQMNATTWKINYGAGLFETITIDNGAAIHSSDYAFV